MHKVTFTSARWGFVVLLFLMIGVPSVIAFNDRIRDVETTDWTRYTDPRFGFSVDYDPNWEVIPRNDDSGMLSTLTFVASDNGATGDYTDPHNGSIKVEIGMYLVSWSERNRLPTRSLKEWTDGYNQLSAVMASNQRRIHESRRIHVDGVESLFEQGETLTNFRYVNIPRGDIVWFIWTNSESEADIEIFDEMVNSFKFGEHTPRALNEVYGNNFRPFPLVRGDEEAESFGDLPQGFLNPFIVPYTISSSWRSPLNGTDLSATCHSDAHDPDEGESEFAIDVARPAWTDIYATNGGSVPFAGWNNNGFGLLYKIQNGTQTAYNAHLAGIHFPHWWNWYVGKGQLIGWVGNTGDSTGNHLHFEVRQNGTSVTLEGMSGFTATDYPYPGNPCGTLTYP